MSALSIQVPFPVFQDRDGQPLDNGYVWVGVANLNSQTNPIIAYYDAALTIQAVQPLRTINGYISNAGTPAQIYVDAVNFSILVQDSKGSMVYSFADGTGISANAAGVTYDPPFTGGVATTVEAKLAQIVSVKDFGAVGDGIADDYTALQLAIDSAYAAGASLYFPTGNYLHSQTLIFKNYISYFGEGIGFNSSFGTTLIHTGVGDGVQINNPINASTPVRVVIRDMCFMALAKSGVKNANFADVGSTQIQFLNCGFGGNSIGLILDQSELVLVDTCEFQMFNPNATAAIWLVNGPDNTPGANGYFTNRIIINNCQINGDTTTLYGIIDDGGTAHTISNNNFNSLTTQLRVTSCRNITISCNEMEGAINTAILFANTYYFSGASSVPIAAAVIQNNFIVSGGTYSCTFTTNCALSLLYSANNFELDSGGADPDNNPLDYVNSVVANGNNNTGTGIQPTNNLNVSDTWTPVVGGSFLLGVGTYTLQEGQYQQNGNICSFQTSVTWTAHTGSGSQIWVSIPKDVQSQNNAFIPVTVISSGITLAAGAQVVARISKTGVVFGSIAGYIQLFSASAGVLTPLTMVSSGTLYISGQYVAR